MHAFLYLISVWTFITIFNYVHTQSHALPCCTRFIPRDHFHASIRLVYRLHRYVSFSQLIRMTYSKVNLECQLVDDAVTRLHVPVDDYCRRERIFVNGSTRLSASLRYTHTKRMTGKHFYTVFMLQCPLVTGEVYNTSRRTMKSCQVKTQITVKLTMMQCQFFRKFSDVDQKFHTKTHAYCIV